MFRAPFYGICQEEVGINWIIVSTTVVIIGTASRRINIFPASSTFAAIEVRLASFMTLLPNSVIYAIPIIFKMVRSEEHTSELQSRFDLVCRLLLEKKQR